MQKEMFKIKKRCKNSERDVKIQKEMLKCKKSDERAIFSIGKSLCIQREVIESKETLKYEKRH